jgi:hypothetical protein
MRCPVPRVQAKKQIKLPQHIFGKRDYTFVLR